MSGGNPITDVAVPGSLPVTRVSPAASQARQNLERMLSSGSTPSAARASLADILDATDGTAADKARITDMLQTFGAIAGKVLSGKPGEKQTVDIGGTHVTLKLNGTHAVGETVVIALASPVDSANAESLDVDLSGAGKLLSTLLEAGNNAKTLGANATQAADATPLASSPANVEELAAKLEQALKSSGLFYESHLAAWIAGRVPLEDIRREPQGKLPVTRQRGGDAVPQELSKLVSQQLDTLEHGAVQWRGQPWSGQPADIAIEYDPEQDSAADNHGSAPAQRSWRIRLALSMPSLGTVNATVHYSGGRASLALQSPATAQSDLQNASSELVSALAARGVAADTIQVASHV